MPRFVLLIPLHYNDGSSVPKKVLNGIFDDLYKLAGGYRLASTGKGAYRMKGGKKQVDVTQEVWVVVPNERAGDLRQLVAGFAQLLEQESIYLEQLESSVEFVAPPPDENE